MNLAFTIFEKDYHFGAAILLNSLYESGYRGLFVLIHRGIEPHWLENAIETFDKRGIRLSAEKIDSNRHLAQAKPSEALRLIKEHPACHKIFYFDSDIVVKCGWEFIEKWADFGISLIEENVKRGMSAQHPQRMMWCEWAEAKRYAVLRHPNLYFNSGFFATKTACKGFLRNWEIVLDELQKEGLEIDLNGGHIKKHISKDPLRRFTTWDQDAMNLALMLTDEEYSPMGPEEMDFLPGGRTLSHAVGSHKPWIGKYISRAMCGKSPRACDAHFWKFVGKPINPFHFSSKNINHVSVVIAKLISRFYRSA
jgi:hypothetical protein